MQKCPTAWKLEQLAAGLLNETDTSSVLWHVESCNPCETMLAELEARKTAFCVDSDTVLNAELWNAKQLAPAGTLSSLILEEGSVLGDYRIGRILGRGGMGIVYHATHLRLHRDVAIKLFAQRNRSNAQLERRFQREISVLGSLVHPNIVRAYDSRGTDAYQYLVMEYVDGVDLSAATRLLGHWHYAAACEVIRQSSQALSYIHSFGMVHRDIKPSNIMLTAIHCSQSARLTPIVKVLDLGIVSGSFDDELTETGCIVGTPQFMAPEQFLDSKRVGVEADVYSLGATLLHLLTGRTSLSRAAMSSLIQDNQFWNHRDFPQELLALLRSMLSEKASERIADVSIIANKLQQFASQEALYDAAQTCDIVKPTDDNCVALARGDRPARFRFGSLLQRTGWYSATATMVLVGLAVVSLFRNNATEVGHAPAMSSLAENFYQKPVPSLSSQAVLQVPSVPTAADAKQAAFGFEREVASWVIRKNGRVSGQDGASTFFHGQRLSEERFILFGVTFLGQDISASQLSRFQQCKHFSMGYFNLKQLTPEHLTAIEIPTIDALHLESQELSRIGNDELSAILDKMRALWGIRIRNLGVDGKVLWNLKGRTDLAYIGVCSDRSRRSGMVPKIGSETMSFIAACPRLEVVNLAYTNPDLGDIRPLANVQTLRDIDLSGVPAAMAVVRAMPSSSCLEFIDINDMSLHPTDLQSLLRFEKLQYLSIRRTNLDKQTILDFSTQRPQCHIRTDFGNFGPTQPDWLSCSGWYRIADNLPLQVY